LPRVWNKRDPECPKDAVYVGRPTKWGNPWSHSALSAARYHVPTRADAVAGFKHSFLANPELMDAARKELRGKDLVCWCAPLPCHADILLEFANAE